MSDDRRDAVAERLRRRYPRSRVPRPILTALLALAVAVAGWWLVTTAWQRANPPAVAEVSTFRVDSDTEIDVTLTVDRRDPSVTVSCRVIAQANDLQVVGERFVGVPPSETRRTQLSVSLITLRRAVSAEVRGCAVS